MYLANTSSCKWIKVDLSESLLPITSVFFFKDFNHLLDRHDVCFTSCLLHCIYNNFGHYRCIACADYLTEFENCTSHFPEVLLQIVRIVRVNRIFCYSSNALLFWKFLTQPLYMLCNHFSYNLLFEGLFYCTSNKLGS